MGLLVSGLVVEQLIRSMDNVEKVFRSLVSKHGGGGRFVVMQHGQVLLDVCDGVASSRDDDAFSEKTLCYVASCTKFVTNVCVAVLVDRGLLTYEGKVRSFWPECGVDVTLEQLLSHQAGLLFFDTMIDFPMEALLHPGEGEPWRTWLRFLESQKPVCPVTP